jgi:arginyl-tRNA synthetase
MLSFLARLKHEIAEKLGKESNAIPEIIPELCPPNVNADFAVNCFKLAASLKTNPELTAGTLVSILSSDPSVEKIEKIKAFVNIRLKSSLLHDLCIKAARQTLSGALLPPELRQTILVEFSSPNTNKPLHLGHLRNNAVGNSISALLKKNGHNVIKANLINDRGIHICKSMLAYQLFGNGITPESAGMKGDHLVGDFYVKFNAEFKSQADKLRQKNPDLKNVPDDDLFEKTPIGIQAQDMLLRWEKADPDVIALWKKMNQWALDGFDETYKRMNISFDKIYRESETYLLGKKIIEKALQQNIFFKREDGAVYADLEKYGLDKKVLLRADGTSVYITQDIGTTVLKHQDFSPSIQIWVVGDEQNHHFKTLFAVLKELNIEWADKLFHLSYGMVNLPSGRMKSREGTVIDADDLFNEMFTLAKNAAIERIGEKQVPKDIDERSEIIGQGALKFMLLKFNPKTTVTFDPQASVKFEGDTGPYIQYACARINSILKNCREKNIPYNPENANFAKLDSPEERDLSVRISLYRVALLQAESKLDTSILAAYLLDTAKSFSRFYRDHSIINADDNDTRDARIKLSLSVKDILTQGLDILGIKIPEAM